jgi:spermidine synthase
MAGTYFVTVKTKRSAITEGLPISSMQKNIPDFLLLFLFFLSGFCNLVFEVVWARMFNLVFGVTVFAVSAVLASFMVGLASGGFFFGRYAEKTKNPVLLFALLHAGICISALGILFMFPAFQSFYLSINRAFSPDFFLFRIILFLLSLALLIVPTTLMGATFPVAGKILSRRPERLGKDVGILYSVNTFGSVIGCLVTIFVLLGSAGMKGTIIIAACLDLAIFLALLPASLSVAKGGKIQ